MSSKIWPDEVRLEMIEKSNIYTDPLLYQYGYYDGYQKGVLVSEGRFREALKNETVLSEIAINRVLNQLKDGK